MTTITLPTAIAVLVVSVVAQHGHGGGHAESFINFVGPVTGHVQEVAAVVKDKHGHEHKVIDYVAQPHYEYKYGVADHHTGDFHGQKESHDGNQVVGEYSLKEHDGNVRTVKYVVDKDGFHAEVHNSQKHTHPTHSYGGQGGQVGESGSGGYGGYVVK